jgi:hypothetical protein
MMEYRNPVLPPALYTNGAFNIDTRQAATMLHQDELLRQRNQMAQAQELDKTMKGELGKVRSADVPDVVANYQKVKALSQAVLYDKKLHRDPIRFAQAQHDLAKAQNDYYTTTSGSADQKARDAERDKVFMSNPDRMDDQYSTLRSTANSLPLSQLKNYSLNGSNIDLSDDNSYFYKGTNTDFTKLANTAYGEEKPKFSLEEPLDKTGLQTKITPVLYGATPAQMRDSLVGEFAKHSVGRDAAYYMDHHYTPDKISDIIKDYNSIPTDKLKKMGLNASQDLSFSSDAPKAVQLASLMAMEHATQAEPRMGTPTFKTNESVKMKMDEEKDRRMAALHQGYEVGNIKLRNKLAQDAKTSVDESGGIYNYIGKLYEQSKSAPNTINNPDGTKIKQYNIPVDNASKAIFAYKDDKGKEVYPDRLRFSEDGKYITPIFFSSDTINKDGTRDIDVEKSKPVTIDAVAAGWGKLFLGVKENAKTIGVNDNIIPQTVPKSTGNWRQRATKVH